MLSAVSNSWALLLGVAFLMLGNGLQSTLLGVRANIEGFSTEATGLVMTCYFVGYLSGSFATPKILSKVGHVRVFAALASMASTSALVHAVFIDPYVWGSMRLITGFCFAGLYIVAESWLNESASNETRGQLLSIYMVVLYGFVALGQLLVNVSDPANFTLFVLMSVLVSVALVPMTLTATRVPPFDAPSAVSLRKLFNTSPLGFACAFGVGACQASIFGIGAVYAGKLGMSTKDISFFMGAISIGGIVLQWPIGKLSDIFDRRKVLIATSIVAGFVALSLSLFAAPEASGLFLASAFLFGALSMPLYSLAIAHTNDHLEASEIVPATAGLIVIGAIGSVIGPLASSFLMGRFGPEAYVYFLAFTLLGIAAFGIYRMTVRKAVPLEDQGDYVAVPASASQMVVTMTPEGEEWYEEATAEAEAELDPDEETSDLLDDGQALWDSSEEDPVDEEVADGELSESERKGSAS